MDISKQALRSTRDQAPPTRLATFVDIVRWQAERIGSWEAFRFLVPAVQSESSIDYTTLDLRIRSVAARLMAAGRPGQRVLVVQQPGMEYIVSLFGCLYAGMVAVPVYPVDVFRLRQTLPRLQAITRDADAAILLTSAEALGITEQRLDGDNSPDQTASGDRLGPLWDLCHQASLLTDQIDIACADDYRPPAIGAHDLAILQYTSGTTASPRGVALQHRQLMANAKQIYDAYHVPDAVCVFWLPPYHDMGLVGGLLLPVFAGRSSVLMSPMSFVQNPISWLEAISTHRGTTTASPNFGYELCLRKIKPEQLESLDLSSLRVAISGAEPIRATTLCNFQQRFAECGLRDTALTPAYGMAEATLAITGKSLETAPRIIAFSATRLHGEMPCGVRATSISDSSNVVSCGVPLQGTEVHVVDPDTRRILPEGHVGEIWVSGPSVATQYWRKPQLSQTTFNATAQDAFVNRNNQSLPYAPVTFLRTGDLGFFYQNELYVSGRLKDLIILSGKNYFAHELEATIQGSHEALKVDGGVAFGCSFGDVDEERLVIVQEVLRPKRFCLDELVHIIRRALAQQHDLYPAAIVLLPAATLNKTSSGKLQRGDCVSRFLGGAFEPLLRWDASSPSLPLKWSSVFEAETDDGLSWHPPAEPEGGQAAEPSIRDQIAKIWTEVLDLPHAAPDQHFLDVGGHSLAALSLLSRLRERLGVVLEFDALFQAPRFADFCEVVEQAIGEVPTSSHYRATSQANISRHALTSDTRLPPHRPQLQGEPDVTTWPPNRLEPRFSTDEAVPTAPHRQSYPLTATQRRFWISQQMEQQQAFLHVELTLHLIGTIDQPALLNAFEQLPERHEALRSHFVVDELGDVQQKFADSVRLQPIWIDWRSDDSHHSDWQQRLADFRRSLIGQPFETLANAPLLRAAVLALPDGKTQILLVAHHVVCDATSLAIIANDLAEYYGQATNPASRDLANHNKSSLDARNHSWTRWLQQYSADTFQDTDDCYWSSRLSGYRGDARLLLPEVNSKRSSTSDSSQRLDPSASYTLRLPSQLVEQLKSRCLQWNVTLFEALLAGWHEVLSRYSEESDLVLGVPVAQRTDSWSEFCVGCLINLLPIRLQAPAELSEATYASRVSAVSQLWRSDWRHAPAPLEKLALETGSKRQSNRLPMIQHLFLFQPPVQAVLRFGEVECDRYSSDYSTLGAYDTALVVQQQRDTNGYTHLELTLAYSPACLTEETARQMLGGISTWLDSALADPTLPLVQLPASNPSQLEHLAHSFQAKHWNSRHRTVMDLFGDQLNKTPDAVVAIDIDGAFTFRELDQTSTRFAKQLAASGVAPGDVVALQLSRNRQILVAALAVWKAGAAYLPLDPAYPVQRIQDVLQDALPRLVLTDVELQRLSQLDIDTSLPVPGTPDDLAYLIYTSGSTGKPKGVAIGHDNLANVLLAFAKGMGVSSGSRILASTTISFDISVLELFLPLVTGATSVIAPASLSSDVDRVISWLHTHPIDIVQATPSSLRMLQAAGWQPNARMTVWCGGEAMQTDLACWILDCGCRLWNVYGPTETTVWSLVCEMDRQSLDQSPWVSIGRPIDSTAIRIVRPSGADSPIGVPGELWIGGLGVGKGYWNRSQLTEQRFVTCSIPQYHSVEHAVSSMRMYRTGDLVRMHSDGNLEFLGRLDRQVKLRGHRIELGEIENALQLSDLVRESAVVLLGSEGKERLAAFYRPARMDDHDATVDSLRSHLAFHLPEPMVPSIWIPLDVIPQTPAGKIDYSALPIDRAFIDSLSEQADHPIQPPSTPLERTLQEIWESVLERTVLSTNDSFFELGGHSLLAAQMLARVRTQTGIQIPLREIYTHCTIASLAACLQSATSGQSFSSQTQPLLAHVASHQGDDRLSPAEQRLWFVDQLEPNHPFYNLPLAARLNGPLDTSAFWDSIADCIQRHETLRCTYRLVDGEPVRRIQPTIQLPQTSIDLSDHDDAQALYRDQITQHARTPFDLEHGPLVRVVLWKLAPHQHVVLLVMHHIISDGWSMSVMMRELSEFYQARVERRPANLTALRVSYRQYANWQQHCLTNEQVEQSLAFWREQLSEAPETLDLPTDFPRPAEQSFDGAIEPFAVSEDLTTRIRSMALKTKTSVFSVLLAAYGLWVSRVSGQSDLTIGTAVANRGEPLVEDLIGFFVNTIVLRQQIDHDVTFEQWVAKVHDKTTEALDHQEIPFEQVVNSLATQRDRSHSPLFQTALILQNTPDGLQTAKPLTIEPLPVDNGTAKFDLTLFLSERNGRLSGHFEYRTSLFAASTIVSFADSFHTLLESAVCDAESQASSIEPKTLDQLPLISGEWEQLILHRGNGPSRRDVQLLSGADSDHVWTQIQRVATATPHAIAVRQGSIQRTYDQLCDAAKAWGRYLRSHSVAAGDQVIVYLPRSIDQIAALLGVWDAEAAFVPIDPEVPAARVQQIQNELSGGVIIAESHRVPELRERFGQHVRIVQAPLVQTTNGSPSGQTNGCPAIQPCVLRDSEGHPPAGLQAGHDEHLLVSSRTPDAPLGGLAKLQQGEGSGVLAAAPGVAYLIFTSGSTGVPKGVAVRHHSLLNFARGYVEAVGIHSGMNCSYLFSPSFDGAIAEIIPTLLVGATIEVIDSEVARDPVRLTEALNRQRVEILAISPAMLAELKPRELPTVQRVMSAGAALPAELVARWLPSHMLFNGYGPTEATVGVCVHRMSAADLQSPSVGRPLPGMRVYVLDSRQQFVPDGVIGEVYIGGSGISDGYWKRPDLTRQTFVPDRYAARLLERSQSGDRVSRGSARMYRTGDLGKWNRHGNLEIVGRADDQIKLRGFRIEPGEISAVLDQLPGVSQSAVIAWDKTDRLIAYIVADPSEQHRIDTVTGEQHHIEQWRELFDASQHSQGVVLNPADDFSGWSSVITGRPIPLDQMRAWADATAERILRLSPKRVLEIGCGTGLILLRIGHQIERYHGIDLLPSAIDQLQETLRSYPDLRSKVTLGCRTADQLDDFADEQFDTIVLNSVVQYFPSGDYLLRVLRAIERLVAPGGKIFLGDLRNLQLHQAFAIAAEQHRMTDEGVSVGEFREWVQARVDHDEELLVDPQALQTSLPLSRLAAVTTELKTAFGDNELNRFRYDAVLWLDSAEATASPDGVLTFVNRHVSEQIAIAGILDRTDSNERLGDQLLVIRERLRQGHTPAELQETARQQGIYLSIQWHPTQRDQFCVQATRAGDSLSDHELVDLFGVRPSRLGERTEPQHGERPVALTNEPLARRTAAERIARWRESLQSRLPAYMIPSAFVMVDRLPRTLQGKLDRAALPPPVLSRHLAAEPFAAAETPTERLLVAIWEELLETSPIGIDDDFFLLGGHSMLAVRMATLIEQRTGGRMPLAALFRKPTIRELAYALDHRQEEGWGLIVPLSACQHDAASLFCIHPAGGTVFCYRELALRIGDVFNVYGVQARGLDGLDSPHRTLVEMASDYADAISVALPTGQINLCGWSLGGNIAYEVACELISRGRSVGILALLDSGMLSGETSLDESDFLPLIAALFPGDEAQPLEHLRQLSAEQQLSYFVQRATQAGIVPEESQLAGPHILDVFQANIQAVHKHQPRAVAMNLLLIRPEDQIKTGDLFDDVTLGWNRLTPSVETASVAGDHAHMLQAPAVDQIAEILQQRLASPSGCSAAEATRNVCSS